MTLLVKDLACRRGGRGVFEGLEFSVEPGHTLLVQGPNGVGKSTLLRVLAGLTRPERGEIGLGAHSPSRDPDDWSAQIAYAGHLDAIKPQLTLAQNLKFWAAISDGGDVPAALRHFNLDHLADRLTQTCSAGQKRRLALARLLLAKRPLWLLDEPTTALDSAARTRLQRMLVAHCASGGIAVVATHHPLDLPNSTVLNLSPAAGNTDPFLEGAA